MDIVIRKNLCTEGVRSLTRFVRIRTEREEDESIYETRNIRRENNFEKLSHGE